MSNSFIDHSQAVKMAELTIFIKWVTFGLSKLIIFPVVDPKVIWFGSEWLNFTWDHFGSVKVTLLSGTYFVSANLYSSDTYLIIYDTLNDILTKHFRRICGILYATFEVLPSFRFLPQPDDFFLEVIIGHYHRLKQELLVTYQE